MAPPNVGQSSSGASKSYAFPSPRHQPLFISLVAGLGVEGDAHSGATIKHRSRIVRDPSQPNLRQVHLVHTELLEELQSRGHAVGPGSIGENITTSGIDLLSLSQGTKLHIGHEAVGGDYRPPKSVCSAPTSSVLALRRPFLSAVRTASLSARLALWE